MIRKSNLNLILLLISLMVTLYLLFFLIPYADKNGFFNENDSPEQGKIIIYFLLSTPIMLGYVVFALWKIKNIVFLKSLNYPLFIFNTYIGFFICAISLGAAILWLMVATIFIPLLALPASFIFGLVKDIQYLRKNKRMFRLKMNKNS